MEFIAASQQLAGHHHIAPLTDIQHMPFYLTSRICPTDLIESSSCYPFKP
jgi:hypothetical protein